MYTLAFIPFIFMATFILNERRISRGVFSLFALVVIMVFSLVYGWRDYSAGTDSYNYAMAFESGDFRRWESGYVLWLRFLQLFGESYQVYFALATFLKLGLLAWAAYNVSKVVGYSLGALFLVLVVYSFTSFDLYTNVLRQGLAMTVSILSVSFYWRGHSRVALLLSALTPFFHSSYLLFFLSYLMATSSIKNSRSIGFGFVVTSMVFVSFLFFGLDLVSVFGAHLIQLGAYVGVEDKVAHYFGMTKASFSELNVFGQLKIGLILSAAGVALVILSKSGDSLNRSTALLVSALILVYSLLAYSSYSFRFLYLVTSLLPFLGVGVMRFLQMSGTSMYVRKSATASFLLIILLNYGYFVIVRGGLIEWKHPILHAQLFLL